jgi:hypothetical protein
VGQSGFRGAGIRESGDHSRITIVHFAVSLAANPPPTPVESEPIVSSRRKTPTMNAVYLLPCSCGKKVRVDAGQAGAKVNCECGQQLAVPTFRGLRNLELESAPISEVARGGQPPGWSTVRGVLFSLGLLVAVVAGGIVCYQLYFYYLTMDGGESWKQELLEQQRHGVDHLAPVEALTEFQEMSKKGLTVDGIPPWGVITSMRDHSFRWFTAGLVALVLGLASLAASLIGVGRQKKAK